MGILSTETTTIPTTTIPPKFSHRIGSFSKTWKPLPIYQMEPKYITIPFAGKKITFPVYKNNDEVSQFIKDIVSLIEIYYLNVW